jgi:hypothetical protein
MPDVMRYCRKEGAFAPSFFVYQDRGSGWRGKASLKDGPGVITSVAAFTE